MTARKNLTHKDNLCKHYWANADMVQRMGLLEDAM